MGPAVNTILKINKRSKDDMEDKKNYKSRVADIVKGNLAIQVPLEEGTGRLGFFPIDTEISVDYMLPDGATIRFQSRVLGRVKDGFPVLLISPPQPEGTQRIQRRNFLRVPAITELALKTVDFRGLHFLTHTIDVGGGGVAFTYGYHEPLQEGERLYGWLLLPYKGTTDHAQFVGKIVRKAPINNNKLDSISVMFTDIKESERSKIIRYCLERQVELRKKGSI